MGAGRKRSGAESVVTLNIQIEATRVTKEVLCFILDSNKSLWKAELTDCGVVLGTNSLEGLGFKITHSDGSIVESNTTDKKGETVLPRVISHQMSLSPIPRSVGNLTSL